MKRGSGSCFALSPRFEARHPDTLNSPSPASVRLSTATSYSWWYSLQTTLQTQLELSSHRVAAHVISHPWKHHLPCAAAKSFLVLCARYPQKSGTPHVTFPNAPLPSGSKANSTAWHSQPRRTTIMALSANTEDTGLT